MSEAVGSSDFISPTNRDFFGLGQSTSPGDTDPEVIEPAHEMTPRQTTTDHDLPPIMIQNALRPALPDKTTFEEDGLFEDDPQVQALQWDTDDQTDQTDDWSARRSSSNLPIPGNSDVDQVVHKPKMALQTMAHKLAQRAQGVLENSRKNAQERAAKAAAQRDFQRLKEEFFLIERKEKEAEQIERIVDWARRQRFFCSPLERPGNDIGLKNHDILLEITRAFMARQNEQKTKIKWDGDINSLMDLEEQQIRAEVAELLTSITMDRKVDLLKELDPNKRDGVMNAIESQLKSQLEKDTIKVLPHIYVFPNNEVGDLTSLRKRHREEALGVLVTALGIKNHELEITEGTRSIHIKSRLVSNGGTYEFDPNFDGLKKIYNACGVTLENETENGTDFLTSGLAKLRPDEALGNDNAVGGLTISMRFARIDVEKVVPDSMSFPGDIKSSEQSDLSVSGARVATPEALENPSFIVGFELEVRHVQPDIFTLLLEKNQNRREGSGLVKHIDKADFAIAFATAIRNNAIPAIRRMQNSLSEVGTIVRETTISELAKRGLMHLATDLNNNILALPAPTNPDTEMSDREVLDASGNNVDY